VTFDRFVHNFQIGNTVWVANDFSTVKNPKLATKWKGPDLILDNNDTNAKIEITNNMKVINISKFKLLNQSDNQGNSDENIPHSDLKFNNVQFNGPITCWHKLIKILCNLLSLF